MHSSGKGVRVHRIYYYLSAWALNRHLGRVLCQGQMWIIRAYVVLHVLECSASR